MTTLTEFPTISLDEVAKDSALLTRIDRKYLLSIDSLKQLLESIDDDTRVLKIDEHSVFEYESVYFDTPDLLSYRMTAHRRRRRFKVRTRSYLDSSTTYLEVKTRGMRGVTVKNRMPYEFTQRHNLSTPARDWVNEQLCCAGFHPGIANQLAPQLTAHYRRSTLLPGCGNQRTTIDTDLRWETPHGTTLTAPDLVIVETKSGSRASNIDCLLMALGHRPTSMSKYATALSALNPALPGNKWARVLRHHFEKESA